MQTLFGGEAVTLPPEAFACLPLERAELPRTVWHIAVAALIGNAWGPVWEREKVDEVTSELDHESGTVTRSLNVVDVPRPGRVVSSGRWSGPMGRAPKRPEVSALHRRAAVFMCTGEDPDECGPLTRRWIETGEWFERLPREVELCAEQSARLERAFESVRFADAPGKDWKRLAAEARERIRNGVALPGDGVLSWSNCLGDRFQTEPDASAVRALAASVFAPGPVPDFVGIDGEIYDMRGES